MLIPILCTLALFSQVPAKATDPAASLSTRLPANQQDLLDGVNECRRTVNPTATNMLKAVWNTEAAANSLTYAKTCSMKHSEQVERTLTSGCPCGENLLMSSYPMSWKAVIKAFCDEKFNMTFGVGPKTEGAEVRHYTQTVGFKSYLTGGDVVYCPDKMIYFYVVHQCPVGNIEGSIYNPYEAGNTCAKCPGKCENGLCTNPCACKLEASNCKDYKSMCNIQQVKDGCPLTCGCKDDQIY
ncbi:cysteine-rich venom protein-like [Pyxicephalus adspersus]|uniref:cysteine-rich venom protein-like n=1 Tax=Pyxicephalus adspersus TaxID=30357 RepID=UPI003B5BBF8A